jgi:hypothetical protein
LEIEKLWKAIANIKLNKLDIDTFETKMFEFEKDGEEDEMHRLQGELNKRSPKARNSSLSLLGENPLDQFDRWNASSALLI